jgi:hypothetical protein
LELLVKNTNSGGYGRKRGEHQQRQNTNSGGCGRKLRGTPTKAENSGGFGGDFLWEHQQGQKT